MNFSFIGINSTYRLSKNIWTMAYTTAVLAVCFNSWGILVPLYLKELGANDLEICVAFALMSIAAGVFQFSGGVLADRMGRKPLVVIPTVISGLLYIIGGFSVGWLAFVLIMILSNIASSIQSPGIFAIMSESVDEKRKGPAFGLFQFFVGLSLAIGPAVGAWLLRYLSIPEMVTFTGAVTVFTGFWRFKTLHETRRLKNSAGQFNFRQIFHGRRLLILMTSICFTAFMNLTVYGPFIPIFSHDVIGLTKRQINLLFAAGPFAAMVISLIAGKLTETLGARPVLAVSVIASGAFTLCWMQSRDFTGALWMFAFAYCFFQVALVAYDTILANIASDKAAGRVLGALGTVTGLISAGAIPLAGIFVPVFGSEFPYWLAFFLALLTAVYSLRIST